MSRIRYRTAQDSTKVTYGFSSKATNPAIGICDANGSIWYIGCKSSAVDHYDEEYTTYTRRYSYSSSNPTIQTMTASRSMIYAFNTYTDIAKGIPAGTYVGQSAYNTFHSYITNGGSRRLAASVTIRHMNITKTFSAGQYVWLSYGYSGKIINLTFGSGNSNSGAARDAGGNSYKQWWSSSANYPTIQLRYNASTGTWSTNSFTLQNNLVFA